MIKAHLIRQAIRLLDAVSDNEKPTFEIAFHDDSKTIEIWDMTADEEACVATMKYEKE